jgi:SAM-dependent methyltransferase
MDEQKLAGLQTTYDLVADEYVQRIYHELDHKPLDRQLLDRFAASLQGLGPVCDLGCGPGHVARYLQEHGADVFGVDLSPGMVERAQKLNPGIEFKCGNMLALDFADETWAGIAAFYSIIHIPRQDVVTALREMKRVLRPNGMLLLAFHRGEETIHLDEWWGQKVTIDTFFFRSDEMQGYLKSAGFAIDEVIERPPYENVEYASQRTYIFARKPMLSSTGRAQIT